jgi:hypothetical protein
VRIDQLSVVLRQRNPWEAIDLGFAMTRQWWREIYGAWLVVFVPLSAAACWLLPPPWALLPVWWLKPALDRIVLHVVSSAVFGSPPRLRETLRSFFTYGRNGLLLWLLPPLRFSPFRSFTLPVRQLENARGRTARQRAQQLRKRVASQAVWLALVCLAFELVAFLSFTGLYDLLVPASTRDTFGAFELFEGAPSRAHAYLLLALYMTGIALIEPLYVAGGFALYLNRRTALEGWDLEVQLRRIAQHGRPAQAEQEASAAPSTIVVLLAAGIALAALLGLPGSAPAQEPASSSSAPPQPGAEAAHPVPLAAGEAKRRIREVLRKPEFEQFEPQLTIEPLAKPEKPQERPRPAGLTAFIQFLASALRGAVWIFLGAIVLFGLYWVLRRLDWIRPPQSAVWTPPATLFGLDVRPESLPQDVAGAAAQLARSGNTVAALSLLYRGTLAALLHRDRIELAGGDTELDCLTKTRQRIAAQTHAYLARLLRAWQAAAYAHRIPPLPEVEQLASEWPGFFGMRPA